jgi:hypothetical protein
MSRQLFASKLWRRVLTVTVPYPFQHLADANPHLVSIDRLSSGNHQPPSAYRNCAHASTYVRFGNTTRKPDGRRS